MDWVELLMLIGVWAALGAAGLFVFSQGFGGRSIFSLSLIVYVAGFMVRAVLIMLNEEWQFFEQKVAGELSLELYRAHVLTGDSWFEFLGHEFAPQVLLNIPVWTLFGESRIALLMSNAMVGAIAGPMSAVLLLRDYHPSVSKRALLLVSLYPACLNFSVFGLRDPIIFLGMIFLICGAVRIWADKVTLGNLFQMFLGTLLVLCSRPELAYVVIVVFMLPVMNGYVNLMNASRRSKRAFGSLMALTLPALACAALLVVAATGLAARNIGAKTINPSEIASKNAMERFERHDSATGGGSHMIPGALYQLLPWYLRVPVQTAGLIMLPFPWAVNSVSKLLAFGDSIYLILVGMFAFVNVYYSNPISKSGFGRLTLFLLLIAFIGFLGLAFVVSNFGNGFRMRFAVTPVILLAGSICPLRVRINVVAAKPARRLAQAA